MTDQSSPRSFKAVCIDAAGEQSMADLIRLMVARSLEKYGHKFEMTWTGNGQEGLDLIIRVRPDLVFLDFTVLGIDGYEVYQRMKADDYMRTIPIIVITANYGAIEHFVGGNIMTVEACLSKPFLWKQLADPVIKIFGLGTVKAHNQE